MWRAAALAVCLLCAAACQPASRAAVLPSPSASPWHPGQVTASPSLGAPSALDLTWTSDKNGWALAGGPQLYSTSDGGLRWTRVGALPGCLTTVCDLSDPRSVTHLRFANDRDAYLFGWGLFTSTDGGRSWRMEPGPEVEDLEPSGTLVYRLAFDHAGCPGPCATRLQAASPGSGQWRTLANLPGGEHGAEVIPSGLDLYVPMYGNRAGGGMDAHTAVYRSRDGGASWTLSADPCVGGLPEFDAVAFAAAPGGFLATLCQERIDQAPGYLLVSNDAGAHWSRRSELPSNLRLLAAGSPAHVIAAGGSPFELLASTNGASTWRTIATVAAPDGPEPAWFLGFEDAEHGHWLGAGDAIWSTADGGDSWARNAFP